MANTTNYNWETPDDTDLVKDGAAAIRTLGSAIDTTTKALNPSTTLGDIEYRSSTANTNTRLAIGSTGQVLTVAGGVPSWATPTTGDIEGVTAGTGISGGGTSGTVTITNSMATEIDAKGDLIVGTGADTFSRLAVGTNGHTLVADSSTATGLKWAAASGGGKVLQVVSYVLSGEKSTSSDTFVDTDLNVTITPSVNTSKILIIANINQTSRPSGNVNNSIGFKLRRDTTDIYEMGDLHLYTSVSADLLQATGLNCTYLDSPATTSATTYKIRFKSYTSGQTVKINSYNLYTVSSTITALEIGA